MPLMTVSKLQLLNETPPPFFICILMGFIFIVGTTIFVIKAEKTTKHVVTAIVSILIGIGLIASITIHEFPKYKQNTESIKEWSTTNYGIRLTSTEADYLRYGKTVKVHYQGSAINIILSNTPDGYRFFTHNKEVNPLS